MRYAAQEIVTIKAGTTGDKKYVANWESEGLIDSGIWIGMDYQTYDKNNDGFEDTLVLTGTQNRSLKAGEAEDEAPYRRKWDSDKGTYSEHNIENVIISKASLSDMSYLFYGCPNLVSVKFDNNTIDTTNLVSMYGMFSGCNNIEEIDMGNFDTSEVFTMRNLFSNCWNLKSLNISNFNTNNVTDMTAMFFECKALETIDISNFDTSKVRKMNTMFAYCENLKTLDLSNFDTSSWDNSPSDMFKKCNKLESIKTFKNIKYQTKLYNTYIDPNSKEITYITQPNIIIYKK